MHCDSDVQTAMHYAIMQCIKPSIHCTATACACTERRERRTTMTTPIVLTQLNSLERTATLFYYLYITSEHYVPGEQLTFHTYSCILLISHVLCSSNLRFFIFWQVIFFFRLVKCTNSALAGNPSRGPDNLFPISPLPSS